MKRGFTLAETLITLLVIGVIAVLTIPALIQQIGDYTLSKQRTVFSRKFEEGLKQMRIDGKLEEKYADTNEFVAAMKKYFKISQVCDKDNLSGCFTPEFTAKAYLNDKETATKLFITSQITTSTNLVENSKYDTGVMGVKFTDGTSMLITYNPNCTGIDGGDTTGNTTGCFGYVADVNAEKSPNVTEKDIISNLPLIKNFGLSFDIQDYKIYLKEDAGYVDNSENGFSKDYWLAAQNKCEEQGASLPTADQLDEIAEKIYSNANCWMDEQYGRPYYQDCDYDIVTSSSLRKAITNSSFDGCVSTWAEEEGFFRCFGETWSDYNDNPDWRRGGTTFFCVK